jgi:amino acid adenylation domain-containing protein
VGVILDRSFELVLALLAILKTGSAYLPLDPQAPRKRLEFMLEDASCRLFLTSSETDPLPDLTLAHLLIDEKVGPWERGKRSTDGPWSAGRPVRALGCAYVIYTSGTTGKPKGVVISHEGLRNLVSWHLQTFPVQSADRATLVARPAFDASTWEIWPYLCAGASLHVIDQEKVVPESLQQLILEQRITRTWMPAPLMESLLGLTWPKKCSLKTLLTGADRLLRSPEERIPFEIYNTYGPTENTVLATSGLVPAGGEGLPSIGRPLLGTKVYILDQVLHLMPVGAAGELYVAGRGLARGYLQRPALTAVRFIPHPFEGPGERLYATGDLASWSEDGTLDFQGRIDSQVKIRGYRVELGEIEERLSRYGGIGEARVVVDESGAAKRLVGLMEVEGEDPSEELLRSYLAEALPDYMVPAAFIFMQTLPLNLNGKVDRYALLKIVGEEAGARLESMAAPRTTEEELLCGIWSEALGLEVSAIGTESNFFELGGHSLTATRVSALVRQSLQLELPLREIFQRPTLSELAAFLPTLRRQGTESVAPPQPLDYSGPLPLSFAQQRLWFLDRMEGKSPTYNMGGGFRLEGKLKVTALEQAFVEVLRRHDSLRTHFQEVNEVEEGGESLQAIQVIEDFVGFDLPVVDLSKLANARTEALRLAREDGRWAFDLDRGSLFRVRLVRLAEEDHILLINQHHIISDGWSTALLNRELAKFYRLLLTGHQLPDTRPLQYADCVVWQRNWFQGDALENQVAYWVQQLEDAPQSLELRTLGPRPAIQTWQGQSKNIQLDSELARRLKSLAGETRSTVFLVLQAAFAELLGRYAGTREVLVGTPVANRRFSELEGVIGLFVNTLVLRNTLHDRHTVQARIDAVKETALGAFAHQDLPFEKLVERLNPVRDTSRSPLFQVMFDVQNLPEGNFELPGLKVSPWGPDQVVAKFDLSLSLLETDQGLTGRFVYNSGLFVPAMINAMATHYRRLLEAFVTYPAGVVSRLPMLTEVEKWQLLEGFNRVSLEQPLPTTVIHLFEEQAERRPHAVALLAQGQILTYGALEQRANLLADELVALGSGPETVVGVVLDRSFDLVVALVGILKTGAAYLPLDGRQPIERLRLMVDDSDCAILVLRSESQEALGEIPGVPLCIDEPPSRAGNPTCRKASRALPEDCCAYVIYTSGSTGKPKGTVIPHRGLINLVRWHLQAFLPSSNDRATMVARPAFDASTWELWPYLCIGASLYLIPDTEMAPEALHRQFAEQRITVSWLSSPLIQPLLSLSWPRNGSLKTVLTGADRLLHHPDATIPWKLYNSYGPTENSVLATSGLVPPDAQGLPTIGRPLVGVRVLLLDASLNLVPLYAVGELYLAGVGLARCYLHRKALTAERFIPNPFGGAGERLYATGDLASWNPEGSLDFHGRSDSQVKIRGFRVELGEIEERLSRHEVVGDARVLVDGNGTHRRLVGAVEVEGEKPSKDELRAFLGETLPEYMIPAAFLFVKSMPLTLNGKIDGRALLRQAQEELVSETRESPQTSEEKLLRTIWADVLGLKASAIGTEDNFFELGGHSLGATRVVSLVRHSFGVDLPVREIFQKPTIKALAAHLPTQETGHVGPAVELKPGRGKPIFLVHEFEGLAMAYQGLVEKMRTDRPIFAFQCPGLGGECEPITSIPELAKTYLKALLEVQPKGPYTLGGWSMGGLIALEMAQLLHQQEQQVARLILIDTYAPEYIRKAPPEGGDLLARLAQELGFRSGVLNLDGEDDGLEQVWRLAAQENPAILDRDKESILGPYRVMFANQESILRYYPAPYPGPLDLIRASHRVDQDPPPARLGWGKEAATSLNVTPIDGNHRSIVLGEHAHALAALLDRFC